MQPAPLSFATEVRLLKGQGSRSSGFCGPFLASVIASAVLFFGTIVYLGTLSTRIRPTETAVMLSLPLCEARASPALAAACPTCRVYASAYVVDRSEIAACSAPDAISALDPAVLSVVLPTNRLVAGFRYAPVITHDPDLVPVSVHVNITDLQRRTVIYSQQIAPTTPPSSETADTLAAKVVARLEQEGRVSPGPSGRRLLKGSSSSSSSSGSGRNGYRALPDLWLDGRRREQRPGGVELLSLDAPVRARVYTRTVPVGSGVSAPPGKLRLDPDFAFPREALHCSADSLGCPVWLPPSLVRTRVSALPFVLPTEADTPYNSLDIRVSAVFAAARAPAAATALLSFHTDDTQWEAAVTDLSLPLVLLVVTAAVATLCCTWPIVRHENGDWRDLSGLTPSRFTRCVHAPTNDIASLSGLDNAPATRHLNLYNNDLRRLTGLSHAPQLTTLDARNNDVSDATALAGCARLDWVDLASNKLRAFPTLNPAPPITYLALADNDLKDVRGLATLAPTLRVLDLRHNDLASLAGVEACANLEAVDASSNDIESIASLTPIADGCPDILVLDVSDNDLSDSDAATLVALFAEKRPACTVVV